MSPRSLEGLRRRLVSLTVISILLATANATAAPIVKDGEVPADGLDHFFLDFDVPDGIKEIEVRHDDKSAVNILDFGLYDMDGYRGWGGGTTEPTIVGELAASRAYVPGPIKAGRWRVIVGKAKVVASPAVYHVEIDLRTAPTLTPIARKPYQIAGARTIEER